MNNIKAEESLEVGLPSIPLNVVLGVQLYYLSGLPSAFEHDDIGSTAIFP